jgi:hypothetical protein
MIESYNASSVKIYDASAVKIYDVTSSLVRFQTKTIFFCFEKMPQPTTTLQL